MKVREDYFKFLSPSGVLKEGTAPVEGIFDSAKDVALFPGIGAGAAGANTDPGQKTTDFVQLALEAHGQEWYAEDFCKHPVMLDFMARFTGWLSNTLPFKRTLLRNNIPGAKAIGVHYDQIFLRYGEPTSITVWVPMGDISLKGGGLIYLENGRNHAFRRSEGSLLIQLQVRLSEKNSKTNSHPKLKQAAYQTRRLSRHLIKTCWRAAYLLRGLQSLDARTIDDGLYQNMRQEMLFCIARIR